jgi:hypothetical protein
MTLFKKAGQNQVWLFWLAASKYSLFQNKTTVPNWGKYLKHHFFLAIQEKQ